MTIDDIILYIGIASGIGIIALLVPGYFRKLLNDNPARSKTLMRNQ
jgi:hypothetical protein